MKTQPLLRVEHLCQYFRSGGATLKAVDDVSFEIGKGEVFGLVGESGCGKTTTGRSIIRLYDITSGSVYFKGVRIAAGTDSYRNEVKRAKAEYKNALKEAKGSENAEKRKAEAEETYHAAIKEQTENIRSAVYDKKNFDKDYRAARERAIAEEYEKLLVGVTEEDKRAALIKKKNEKIRLAKKSSIMNDIQMIFQDPIASLDPRMTVREIIAEGLVIRGIKDKKYIDEEVYRVLDLVGLRPEHAGRYPHEFSGGQRQRIGIARAILFIAHDLSVVKYFSDRIGVMYFGKLVELATSDELFAHPLHPYTKSLLSAIPLPDPAYEKLRKRIVYNPLAEHDYGTDKPVMREVSPGHFVYCNEEEFNRYKKQLTEGE